MIGPVGPHTAALRLSALSLFSQLVSSFKVRFLYKYKSGADVSKV